MQIVSEALIDAKFDLIELVHRWARGRCSSWELMDRSKSIRDRQEIRQRVFSTAENTGLALLIEGALDLVTEALTKQILPCDAGKIIELLQSDERQAKCAYDQFWNYWEYMDFGARREELQHVWACENLYRRDKSRLSLTEV